MIDVNNITLPWNINGGDKGKFLTARLCGIAVIMGLLFCAFTSWLDVYYLDHHPNAQPSHIWGDVRLYTRNFNDADSDSFVFYLPRAFRSDMPFVAYKGLNVEPLSVIVLLVLVGIMPWIVRTRLKIAQTQITSTGVQFTLRTGQVVTRSYSEFSKIKLINLSLLGQNIKFMLLEGNVQNQATGLRTVSIAGLQDLKQQILLQADGKSQNIVIFIPRGADPQNFARQISGLIKLPLEIADA